MEEKETKISQHEDISEKAAWQFFKDEVMAFLGIDGKVVNVLANETIHLELKKMFEDLNFLMEDDTIKHFEFESTNEGLSGLKRFRVYEAILSYQYKKAVTTYVLYSGKIKNPMTKFTEGLNTFHIQPIIMQDKNADEVIEKLQQKVEAMVYVMADKFLDSMDMEALKEELKMTRQGRMMYEEGRMDGRLEGIIVVVRMCKKLGALQQEAVEQIMEGFGKTSEEAQKEVEKYWDEC